jgi:hypothetical protein
VESELETCGDTNTGLSEISKNNDAIVARAKKLYEHAIEHNLANKLPSASRALEELLCLCPDYPGAVPLLENVRRQIAQQLKIVENYLSKHTNTEGVFGKNACQFYRLG